MLYLQAESGLIVCAIPNKKTPYMINRQLVGYGHGVSNRSRIMQCQACLFFISLGEFNSSREGLVWQSASVD
jgi:hypothetical protein